MQFISDTICTAPTIESIQSLEEYYRILLPDQYKRFLVDCNGGCPVETFLSVEGKRYVLERFLAVFAEDENLSQEWFDVDVVITALGSLIVEQEDQIGVSLFPVAVLDTRDFICINYMKGFIEGSIVIFNPDYSEIYKPSIKMVAGSFGELLSILPP